MRTGRAALGKVEVVRLREREGVHEEVNYRGVGTRGNVTDSEAEKDHHVTRQWGSEGEGEGHARKEDKDTHLGPVPVALNGVSTNHGGHGRGGC